MTLTKSCLAVFLVVLLILAILLACALAGRRGGPELLGLPLALGGALAGASREAPPAPPPRLHPRGLHTLGVALERYAQTLGPEHALAVHPLDRDRYEALPEQGPSGGGAEPKGAEPKGAEPKGAEPKGAKPKSAKPWSAYPSWGALHGDKKAVAAYFAQRAEALNNPDFDWAPVLRELAPRLLENREYIGLVNAEADGRTLRLEACEASPIEAGTMESDTAFAAVPAELVRAYAERPALFLFHTHPSDPRGSPLPSSHDLSTALYLAAAGRFAGSVVVSRYGALLYTLDWGGYKAVNEAKDWGLALSNLSHDVVAAHEAVRSWAAHSLADYLAFYPRHRLMLVAWPSAEMVADSRRFTYLWNLETPIDHELIAEHREDIARHLERQKEGRARGQRARYAEKLPEADLGLD